MKSINRKDFIAAGSVSRVFGTKGEVQLKLIHETDLSEWAFLEIKGKPVPFFIERKSGTDDQPVVKLQGVNTPDQASKFRGLNLLRTRLYEEDREAGDYHDMKGYLLSDASVGEIGLIQDIEVVSGKTLFKTIYKKRETLIPAEPDFIVLVDHSKSTIYLDLPDGLIELQS